MEYITNYWAQLTVLIGAFSFLLKQMFDYRYKIKELRYKYFYEKKAAKIIALHKYIVEIQKYIDNNHGDKHFEKEIIKKRKQLEHYFWESRFYFEPRTNERLDNFFEWLEALENKAIKEEIIGNNKETKKFVFVNKMLLKELKKELK
jgi:hypothetical protein